MIFYFLLSHFIVRNNLKWSFVRFSCNIFLLHYRKNVSYCDTWNVRILRGKKMEIQRLPMCLALDQVLLIIPNSLHLHETQTHQILSNPNKCQCLYLHHYLNHLLLLQDLCIKDLWRLKMLIKLNCSSSDVFLARRVHIPSVLPRGTYNQASLP